MKSNEELEKLPNEFDKKSSGERVQYAYGLTESIKFDPNNFSEIEILNDETVRSDNLKPINLTFLG